MKNKIVASDLKHIHQNFHHKEKIANSTILITGCAGFLGYYFMHYFTAHAQELGIKRIIGLDNFISGGKGWVQAMAKECPCVNLHSFDVIKDDFTQIEGIEEVDYILHMASIASPHFYRLHPIETLDANVTGLQKLLNIYKDKAIKGFLMFSSSEIYGDPAAAYIPTDESYRGNVACIGPRACYDEAKRFSETLCYLYAKQYDLPLVLVRPFNNYGPGMSIEDRRLPADFAKAVFKNEDIVMYSDGSPTRTFCYVADAIAGYLQALTYGQFDIFNIGKDGNETSVQEMAIFYVEQAQLLLGYTGSVRFEKSTDENYLTDNPNRRSPIIHKARTLLGYNPTITVQQGVHNYLSFLKEETHA